MHKSVLLVDDDTPIRDLYKKLLTQAGYAVDSAVNGVEGLTRIKESKYDLVLLDIMMPQIDGIGVLDTLNQQQIPHPPILFMTNLLNDPATKQATQKGAIGVITKVNLDPAQFVATIQQVLGDLPVDTNPESPSAPPAISQPVSNQPPPPQPATNPPNQQN